MYLLRLSLIGFHVRISILSFQCEIDSTSINSAAQWLEISRCNAEVALEEIHAFSKILRTIRLEGFQLFAKFAEIDMEGRKKNNTYRIYVGIKGPYFVYYRGMVSKKAICVNKKVAPN
jgi:hypothetical protein